MDRDEIIKANIQVHSKMAKTYSTSEPHFRPENIQKVSDVLGGFFKDQKIKRALDLGCGTGFMINILKKFAEEIDGVDVTQEMLDQVDKSGKTQVRLHKHDTGTFGVEKGTYDVVTMYSFIHHLFDVKPTFKTAYEGLKSGGKLFIGLEPNFYFWNALRDLDHKGNFDEIVAREVRAVDEDEVVAIKFGVSKDTLDKAEFSKSIKGGFKEEELLADLKAIGFKNIRVEYDWFLGQGMMINEASVPVAERFKNANVVDGILKRQLPLTLHLFKYLSVFAER